MSAFFRSNALTCFSKFITAASTARVITSSSVYRCCASFDMAAQSSTTFNAHDLRAINRSLHACKSFESEMVSGGLATLYFGGNMISDRKDFVEPCNEGWTIRPSYTNISFYLLSARIHRQ